MLLIIIPTLVSDKDHHRDLNLWTCKTFIIYILPGNIVLHDPHVEPSNPFTITFNSPANWDVY